MKRFLAFAAVLGLAYLAFAASPEVLDGESRTKLLSTTDARYQPLGTTLDLTGSNNGGGTGVLTNFADIHATVLHGDGSKLTGIASAATTNASELTTGTLDDARLGATVVQTDINNTYGAGSTNTFNAVRVVGGGVLISNYANGNTFTVGRASPPTIIPKMLVVFNGSVENGLAVRDAGGAGPTLHINANQIYCDAGEANPVANKITVGVGATGLSYLRGPWNTTGITTIGENGFAITNILTTALVTNFGTVNAGTVTRLSIPLSKVKASDAISLGLPIEYPVASGSNLIFQAIATNNTVLVDAINNTAVNVVCPDGTLRITAISY